MPVAAKCPSCGAPLSEASVLALAPVCKHCDAVITSIGGTLGLMGAYGVSDPTITRRRVEADLAVFREYQEKYRGMKEACIQQLGWGVERYAKLPQPPELLALEEVPSFWGCLFSGLPVALACFVLAIPAIIALGIALEIGSAFGLWLTGLSWELNRLPPSPTLLLLLFGGPVLCVVFALYPHFRATIANGQRPQENARRQRAYEEAVATALKVADPLKAAEDHRLRSQIRELESLAKTVGEKEAEVRRLLATH